MSVEILEIAGLLAAAIAMTAVIHRALQPLFQAPRATRSHLGSPA